MPEQYVQPQQKFNWKSKAFWLGIFGGAKLVLDQFGIKIPDEIVDNAANVLAFILTMIAIYLPHRTTA